MLFPVTFTLGSAQMRSRKEIDEPVTGHECIELRHYREECERLRWLLFRVEMSNERLQEELYAARKAASPAVKVCDSAVAHETVVDGESVHERLKRLEWCARSMAHIPSLHCMCERCQDRRHAPVDVKYEHDRTLDAMSYEMSTEGRSGPNSFSDAAATSVGARRPSPPSDRRDEK